ncbi:hypothetical protein PROFUN_03355 [Planoprotostelium fungivorum]|uniref:Nucleoside phosphorylase domain-containing protein n=1 Tax=Planoprotostelium fungivorum TaxID=1890364 RepID=A0A2P6NWE1_9EUKA|nr:hypothetical protein PROFUN_03355 [Planoprotostelium fungivorum]
MTVIHFLLILGNIFVTCVTYHWNQRILLNKLRLHYTRIFDFTMLAHYGVAGNGTFIINAPHQQPSGGFERGTNQTCKGPNAQEIKYMILIATNAEYKYFTQRWIGSIIQWTSKPLDASYNNAVCRFQAAKSIPTATLAALKFNTQYLISLGISGGLKDVKVGDVVIGTQVFLYTKNTAATTKEGKLAFQFQVDSYSILEFKPLQIDDEFVKQFQKGIADNAGLQKAVCVDQETGYIGNVLSQHQEECLTWLAQTKTNRLELMGEKLWRAQPKDRGPCGLLKLLCWSI